MQTAGNAPPAERPDGVCKMNGCVSGSLQHSLHREMHLLLKLHWFIISAHCWGVPTEAYFMQSAPVWRKKCKCKNAIWFVLLQGEFHFVKKKESTGFTYLYCTFTGNVNKWFFFLFAVLSWLIIYSVTFQTISWLLIYPWWHFSLRQTPTRQTDGLPSLLPVLAHNRF